MCQLSSVSFVASTSMKGCLIPPQSFLPSHPVNSTIRPWNFPSSDTVCWLWKVSTQDEICHRGGQHCQGKVEEFGIQARVVADTRTPGNNGVLHTIDDISNSGLSQLHHVIQLVSICWEGAMKHSVIPYFKKWFLPNSIQVNIS